MNTKLLVGLVVIIIVAATAVPAVYFLSTKKEAPPPSPPKTVQPKNNPPVASFTSNVTKAYHGAVISFDASASHDPEGDPLNYSWDFGDGERDIGAKTAHAFLLDGSFTVMLNVSDGKASNSTSHVITISNAAPVITAYFPTTVSPVILEGQMQNFSVNATTADGDPLVFGWSLDNKTIPGNAARYTFMADFNSADSYKVKVIVTDGKLDASREWTLTVRNVNRPPQMILVEPADNFSIAEGAQMQLRATANDPDNDALTYVWVLDNNVKENGTGEHAAFMYAPDYRAAGVHYAKVTFSDGPSQVSWTWAITVKHTNRPPVITNTTPNATVSLYETVNTMFIASADDPDGDALTYSWTLDGASVGSSTSNSYELLTNYSSAGKYRLDVEVSDGKLKVSTHWNITVLHLNRPPAAKASVDFKERNVGQPFTFNASASSDPDGDEITFFWDFGDGNNSTSETVSHAYFKAGKFRANLTVTDVCGTAAKAFVDVTVKPGLMEVWRMGPFTSFVDKMLVDDVDADGKKELVAAFEEGADANDVFHGHFKIFDLATHSLEWTSPDIGQIAGLVATNLDGDPALEIVTGVSTSIGGDLTHWTFTGKAIVYDGASHAIDWEGASGFGEITTVEVTDINNDMQKEILLGYATQATIDTNTYLGAYEGGLAVYTSSYGLLWNTTGWGAAAIMTAQNLDNDANVELAVFTIKTLDLGGGNGWDMNISILEWRSGSLFPQGEVKDPTGKMAPSRFTVVDFNSDSNKEIFFGTTDDDGTTYTGNVYVYSASMSRLWKSPDMGGVMSLEVAEADSNSPNMEIIVGVGETDNDDLSGRMIVYASTFTEKWRTADIGFVQAVAVGDINHDQIPEIVVAAVTYRDSGGVSNGTIHVYSGITGLELYNTTGFHDFTSPILLVDTDADGTPELMFADWLEADTVCNIWLFGI